KEWAALHRSAPYLMKEAAILFESNTDKDCDAVITIVAPEELRINRIRNRDQRSVADIRRVIASQLPDEEKIIRSRFIIRNGETDMVLPQVLSIHEELMDELKHDLRPKEAS
ncbi:MAG: dephospho-CoA kinase, partial [Bacteroidota bacterium]